MLKLGKIKWFGTYNSNYQDYNHYGFLKQMDTEEDIFVHKADVDPNSRFLEYHPAGYYVVYEERFSEKKNKSSAVHVRFLSELDKEEQKALYQNYQQTDSIAELLRRQCPDIFTDEPLSFFVPYLNESPMKTLFLKKCREMDQDELKKYLKEHFEGDSAVIELLRNQYPDIFADEPLSFFVPYLNESPMKTIFLKKCREMDQGELKEYLKEHFEEDSAVIELLRSHYPDIFADEPLSFFIPYLNESPMKTLFLKKCREMDQDALKECLKDHLTEDSVVQVLLPEIPQIYLPLIAFSIEDPSKGRLVFPAWENASHAVKSEVLRKLFSEISWKEAIDKEENAPPKEFDIFLLRHLEADVYSDVAVEVAASMREWNVLFNLKLWAHLTESMKIRILLYCSNFPEEWNSWFPPLQRIYQWEKAHGKDGLALIVLRFFSNCYSTDRQRNFMAAHEELMQYLAESFSVGLDVTHGLNVLLDRCRATSDSSCMRFCDARIWERRRSIFCPEGPGRPENGWTECKCFQGMDLSLPIHEASYQDQHFSDFLCKIGFLPDLRSIYIKNAVEYPYRIAAYVNRLLDMRQHMKCSKCGAPTYPKFNYSKEINTKLSLDVFYCPESKKSDQPSGEHDTGVYLNFCNNCKKIIDSRECFQQEEGPKPSRGEYLCMYCGATERVEPGKKCPKCGTEDPNFLIFKGGWKDQNGRNRGGRILCKKCGHNGIRYRSSFEIGQEVFE